MDGRIQKPLMEYMSRNYPGVFPDTITFPGIVKNLSRSYRWPVHIKNMLAISMEKHKSSTVFIVAHPDCAGNPVDDGIQLEQLRRAASRFAKKYPEMKVKSLWVENNKEIKEIE
jgi:hypothetical protein